MAGSEVWWARSERFAVTATAGRGERKLKQLVAVRRWTSLASRRCCQKVLGPQARREAVRIFCAAAQCSERHACGQLEVLRAMVRYRRRESRFAQANEQLRARLRKLAEVYRTYMEAKLIGRKRERRRRLGAQARVLLASPTRKNETWTMDRSPFSPHCLASFPRCGPNRGWMGNREASGLGRRGPSPSLSHRALSILRLRRKGKRTAQHRAAFLSLVGTLPFEGIFGAGP